MGAIQYALFAYVLTAVIAFAVVGVIVGVNKLLSGGKDNGEGEV